MIGFTASSEMIVAVCSLLGLFLVVLVVLMRRRVSSSTVDVDDFHIEKQSKNNSTKKIKQKKTKAATNAAPASSSNSTQTKVSIKQSPVKNASKEKQTDEKKKPVPKKGSTSSNASSQRVQQTAETLGDWSIAVSKKKQKTKKTDSSAENLKANVTSNGQFINDAKTADSKEIGGKFPCDEATQSFVTQEHDKSMVDKKKSDETGALLFEPHQVDTLREPIVAESSRQPVELSSPSPLESGEGDLSVIRSVEKSKKTSKKKKSKLTTEMTQPGAVSDTQDDKKSANSSLMASVDPQAKTAKLLPDDVSAVLASPEYASKREVAVVQDDAARLPKDSSKATNACLLEEIFEAHLENNSPVAISTSSRNKMSDKESSELVSSSVSDVSVTVSGSNLAKNVASIPLKDVASSPGVSTLPSQIVFDELGLKDGDLNSNQQALKKKKKVRKDV